MTDKEKIELLKGALTEITKKPGYKPTWEMAKEVLQQLEETENV